MADTLILTDQEYETAVKMLSKSDELMKQQKREWKKHGHTRKEIKKLSTAAMTKVKMDKEDLAFYRKLKKGKLPKKLAVSQLGRLLVYLRIASGMSQVDLAARLNIEARAVQSNERNDYHGVNLIDAVKVLDAIGVDVSLKVRSR